MSFADIFTLVLLDGGAGMRLMCDQRRLSRQAVDETTRIGRIVLRDWGITVT